MAPPLMLLTDIRVTLGSAPLLDGATLSVSAGERLCLVGRNGSGKSTLLKIASGEIAFDGGTRFLQPGTTMRYLPQEPDLSAYASTMDYVMAGLGPNDDEYRARYLLEQLGLTGAELPTNLSGGEARRAALARTLAPEPDLLLLDEPTNHLDLPAIEWLESELKSLSAGIVLISHDRRLLEKLSRAIVWLDRGQTRRLDRGFEHFEAWRDQVLEEEETTFHKLGRQIAREEDWLRYGVTARRKRNVKRLADLGTLRTRKREHNHQAVASKMVAADAAISGKLVAVAEGVAKAYAGRPIVRRLDLRVLRGDRLGIVGPNGAGKTTLLKLLTGQITPDEGRIKLGTALDVVTLDQQRAALNPATRLADTLTGGKSDMVTVGTESRHVIGYMKDFLFKPEQARTPVGTLSGGERGRLLLAAALARPSNLLILDEPTNDLDLETLDLLQEMLGEYPGTILLVSHDRDFLDRVATSTLAAEGDGWYGLTTREAGAGTILVTAHLDHLGVGKAVDGDTIYNGANDDAAGTTAVLELAHALAAGPKLRRSVLFVCYGSEEAGELGSTYFGAHSPVPLAELVANLEFEMIGTQDPKMPKGVLLFTGWERSNLGPTLKAHGALLGPDPYPEQHFFERSDNYALALKGVVAHTAAGWGTPPTYHQPSDDLAHLDLGFMTAAIQSLVEPVRWLAESEFKPEWNAGGQPKGR